MSAGAVDGRVLKGARASSDEGDWGDYSSQGAEQPDWEKMIGDVCSNSVQPESCVSSLISNAPDFMSTQLSLTALDLAGQEARVASRYMEDLKTRNTEEGAEGAFEWCTELLKRSRYRIHDSHKELLNLISYINRTHHMSHHDHMFMDTISDVVDSLTSVQDNRLLCQGHLSLETSWATAVYYYTLPFTNSIAHALAVFTALSHQRHF